VCKSWACWRWFLFSAVVLVSGQATQQSVHLTCGSLRDLQAFFWLRVFSTSQTLSTPAHLRVTQTVRPHAFFLGLGTARNGQLLSLLAIRFSLQSFFLRCHSFSLAFFSLLVFSSSITWSACQHFLHIGSRDCQVDFVGSGLFGCGVLLAIVS